MTSRKIVGRIVRYGIAAVCLIPILLMILIEAVSRGLLAIAEFLAKHLRMFVQTVNIKMTAWESNSPEGTMNILKNTEIK